MEVGPFLLVAAATGNGRLGNSGRDKVGIVTPLTIFEGKSFSLVETAFIEAPAFEAMRPIPIAFFASNPSPAPASFDLKYY